MRKKTNKERKRIKAKKIQREKDLNTLGKRLRKIFFFGRKTIIVTPKRSNK